MTETVLKNSPRVPIATLLLAHGAGAPMDSGFMETISALLCDRGCEVIRFEFPYMAERRVTGKKRPPDRAPILLKSWRHFLAEQRKLLPVDRLLLIGGKSLGGRIASLIADDSGVDGLVCLGYPFHPVGKPERLRTEHLGDVATPTLIIQGTRDPFGTMPEVKSYSLSHTITIKWLPDGDHDFKPRIKSGFTHDKCMHDAADLVIDFIRPLTTKRIV